MLKIREGSGGTFRLSFETKDDLLNTEEQYRQLAYVNLTQPLLKNAGIETTDTPIRIAEGDAGLAFQSYRQEEC